MGNLVGISCGEKDPLGRIALRGKNVPLARDVTERFTTGKMECKKGKTHVLQDVEAATAAVLPQQTLQKRLLQQRQMAAQTVTAPQQAEISPDRSA